MRPEDENEDENEDEGDLPWEAYARTCVEDLIQEIAFDEIRGVVHLMSGVDHRFNRVREGFTSLEKVRETLVEQATNEWINYVPFDDGEAVFDPDVEDMVEHALEEHGVVTFFEGSDRNQGVQLFSAFDSLLPKAGIQAQVDLANINEELILYLARHPEKMRDMESRKFEELIAELFKNLGYEVEVTPKTRDGGLDIRAYHRSDIGTLLGIVECKRYSAKNKVSVDVVRGLYGVVEAHNANFGLIATTSTFTADAKAFKDQTKYRIQLADFEILKSWLNRFNQKS